MAAQTQHRRDTQPQVAPWRIVLPSLVMSVVASGIATLFVRRLRTLRAMRKEEGHQAEQEVRPVRVNEQNFVFVLMPFAISLDGLRALGAARRFGARLRAERILRERYARGEIDDERYEKMRRELAD